MDVDLENRLAAIAERNGFDAGALRSAAAGALALGRNLACLALLEN